MLNSYIRIYYYQYRNRFCKDFNSLLMCYKVLYQHLQCVANSIGNRLVLFWRLLSLGHTIASFTSQNIASDHCTAMCMPHNEILQRWASGDFGVILLYLLTYILHGQWLVAVSISALTLKMAAPNRRRMLLLSLLLLKIINQLNGQLVEV